MMRRATGWTFAIWLTALVLASPSGAGPKKRSKLRHELERLQARVAQLESRLQYQGRRMDALLPTVIGGAGGLCADPCATDSDGDGVGDCEDLCPCDPGNADDDGDGMPNCWDPCPDDATDACIDPCRMDTDGDGVTDCTDPCPWDPAEPKDADEDGIPDCADPCPDGTLACGEPCALDTDGDGLDDCVDPCPFGDDREAPCIALPPVPAVR